MKAVLLGLAIVLGIVATTNSAFARPQIYMCAEELEEGGCFYLNFSF